MEKIDAPFLEMSFYFASLSDGEAFTKLISTLTTLGATFAGSGYVHRGTGMSHRLFGSINDPLLEPVVLGENSDLHAYMSDPDIRLVQVAMRGATGTLDDKAEIITYESISSEAAHVDHHPIAIWTEGELFSGTFRQDDAKRARMVGRKIYQRFRELVVALQPSYAAITSEWGLECPTDLQHDSGSLAFCDFFVSGSYLGAAKLAFVQQLFTDTYHESVNDGIYVSCMREFNPAGKSLESSRVLELSSMVARLIAQSNSTHR